MAIINQWRAESLQLASGACWPLNCQQFWTLSKHKLFLNGTVQLRQCNYCLCMECRGLQHTPLHNLFSTQELWWVSSTAVYECLHTLGFVFAHIRDKKNTTYSLILWIICQWNRDRISLCKSGDQRRSFSCCGGLLGNRWARVFLGWHFLKNSASCGLSAMLI